MKRTDRQQLGAEENCRSGSAGQPWPKTPRKVATARRAGQLRPRDVVESCQEGWATATVVAEETCRGQVGQMEMTARTCRRRSGLGRD